jgi:predicted small metal-binding protein
MPSFKCKDIGMDCPFEAEADTEKELMAKVAKHAKEAHGIETISPELQDKIKQAIKP